MPPTAKAKVLRKKAEVLAAAHSALQDLSSLPLTVPLYFPVVSAILVFSPEPVNLTPASGPLHWLSLVRGPLSPKYLHGSLPHLLQVFTQMSPSQVTLGLKITVPSYPTYLICLPSIIVSRTHTTF